MEIDITGTPQPQARPRTYMRGESPVTWSPHSDWRRQVYTHMFINRPRMPLEGCLTVSLTFRMPKPKSARKSQFWANKRPDWDNLAKAVIDAAQDARWIKDDGQIVSASIRKRYPTVYEVPGCHIKIEVLAYDTE